ncbi:MAG: hypothetical protein ACR2RE_12940 [Geminicoccaceae bacterium]
MTDSDAVVELMANVMLDGKMLGDNYEQVARDIFSALSDAGLAVLPLNAVEFVEPMPDLDAEPCTRCGGTGISTTRPHPSQLETKR